MLPNIKKIVKSGLVPTILVCMTTWGQTMEEKTFSIGLALNSSREAAYSTKYPARGGSWSLEYKQSFCNWFDVISYGAYASTKEDSRDRVDEEFFSTQNVFRLGNKARIEIPVPYAGIYFDWGFGFDLGRFETNSPRVQHAKKGLVFHTLYGFGLDITRGKQGVNPNLDIGFVFYKHHGISQTSAGLYFRFPVHYKNNGTSP